MDLEAIYTTINYIKGIYNILPKKEIKQFIKEYFKKSKYLINIYGSYDYFKESQNFNEKNLDGDFYRIYYLDQYKSIIDKEIPVSDYYLYTEITFYNYIKSLYYTFTQYYKRRKDLSFKDKLKMSYLKTKRNICKFHSFIDLRSYFNNKDKYDKQFEELFNIKLINKIYLYKKKK